MADNATQEDDLSLPRAAVNKMIKETIPNIRVSNDARELILNCCTEFIHLVSSEANEICNRNTKKTISPEHIMEALQSLGFHGYVSEVQDVLQQFKTKSKKKSHRLENLGIPEEELLRQQQELFQKARMEQAQEEWMHMQQMTQGTPVVDGGAAPHHPPVVMSSAGSSNSNAEATTASTGCCLTAGGRVLSTASLGAPPPLTPIHSIARSADDPSHQMNRNHDDVRLPWKPQKNETKTTDGVDVRPNSIDPNACGSASPKSQRIAIPADDGAVDPLAPIDKKQKL